MTGMEIERHCDKHIVEATPLQINWNQQGCEKLFLLTPGISYQVADHAEPHRSYTPTGVTLFIVD
jgi:hypothetical protein